MVVDEEMKAKLFERLEGWRKKDEEFGAGSERGGIRCGTSACSEKMALDYRVEQVLDLLDLE